MLFALLRFLSLFVPYGLLLLFVRGKKTVQTNLKTLSGRSLNAFMITENYGILVMKEKYINDRLKKLKEKQDKINEQNEALAKEFNSLSFEAREVIFNKPGEEE